MVFGSCCTLTKNKLTAMKAKSVKIEGFQRGLIVNFEVTQTFFHTDKIAKEISYVFPNDFKICIYEVTFVVGDEIIKPKLAAIEEATKTYEEAVISGHMSVLGSNLSYGLTSFKLGNLQPNTECKVILKIAFTAQLTREKTFFIKFPLDVYTPTGSKKCLGVDSSEFSFTIQADKEEISKITSNINNAQFDEETKIFTINDKIQKGKKENSILITFETVENITSSAFLLPENESKYQFCALTISPQITTNSNETNSEFVFVVDCSGSMGGISIQKASECLEFFIKSLMPDCYFNVIRFGSSFQKLFKKSEKYTEKTAEQAIQLAQNLKADLGGTDIYDPLSDIFNEENLHGQRQIFIMTDGEVSNVENVLELVSENSNNNRCFSIGIGRGCDAGLVEGIANSSGGKSDFVQSNDNISEKVIPQLQSSLNPLLNYIEIHVENNDSFEVSPFPLPVVNVNSAVVVYLRSENKEMNSFLVEGKYGSESVEIQIDEIKRLQNFEEDQLGCSGGKNIWKAILPLFSYNIIKSIEKHQSISKEEEEKVIELSIESGVLSKFTGFVGVSEKTIPSIVQRKTGRTLQKPRRCTGGKTPRTSLNAKGARKSTPIKFDDEDFQNDKSYSLLSLTRMQTISGFWNNLAAINEMLGTNVVHIDQIKLNDKTLEKNCVATILALAAIHVKSAYEKNSWILIERKALSWLKKNLSDVNVDEVISKIEKLIP